MKQIIVDDKKKDFRGMTNKDGLVKSWERQFLNETAKFISGTFLQREDLGKIFIDSQGQEWKILGQMDGKDMPCEKISTNEIFVWDRWKVSALVYPDKHAKAAQKTEYIYPKLKSKRVKKDVEQTKLDTTNPQLDLFN